MTMTVLIYILSSCLIILKLLFSEHFYDNTLNIGFLITKKFTELFKVSIHTVFFVNAWNMKLLN